MAEDTGFYPVICMAKTGEKPAKIDKNKILTTEKRRKCFEALLDGCDQREAAKRAGFGYAYVRHFITTYNVNALVRQERAIIEQRAAYRRGITIESQIKQFQRNLRLARKLKQVSAANQALAEINRLCGLYEVDNEQRAASKMVLVLGAPEVAASNSNTLPKPVESKVIEGEAPSLLSEKQGSKQDQT